ncbi:MAG: putative rane-associated protein [Daejeonella sp.]|nr:putative rane-associated protein [Daejeonella sp.]
MDLLISFHQMLNPEFYILHGGLWVVLFIIFAETGLMAGFFLPGDSLLFLCGIYSRNLVETLPGYQSRHDWIDLLILVILIVIYASLGNLLGYWFGKKGGSVLFKREDSFLFKKRHVLQAKEFYEKHTSMAIILARFLPIVRTFTPIVAGAVRMEKTKFIIYSITGALGWAALMLFSGKYLYLLFLNKFSIDLKMHLELIIIGMVLITTLPVVYRLLLQKKN